MRVISLCVLVIVALAGATTIETRRSVGEEQVAHRQLNSNKSSNNLADALAEAKKAEVEAKLESTDQTEIPAPSHERKLEFGSFSRQPPVNPEEDMFDQMEGRTVAPRCNEGMFASNGRFPVPCKDAKWEKITAGFSWVTAKKYCEGQKHPGNEPFQTLKGNAGRLCTREEYCPKVLECGDEKPVAFSPLRDGHGDANYQASVPFGETWAPYMGLMDDDFKCNNCWIQIGRGSQIACQVHDEIVNGYYGMPAWGLESTAADYKSSFLCCWDDTTVTADAPDGMHRRRSTRWDVALAGMCAFPGVSPPLCDPIPAYGAENWDRRRATKTDAGIAIPDGVDRPSGANQFSIRNECEKIRKDLGHCGSALRSESCSCSVFKASTKPVEMHNRRRCINADGSKYIWIDPRGDGSTD